MSNDQLMSCTYQILYSLHTCAQVEILKFCFGKYLACD